MIVGEMIFLVGGVISIVQAFRESLFWGLFYLFLPLLSPVFVNKFWKQREWVRISSFMLSGGGFPIFIGAFFDLYKSREYVATDADLTNPKHKSFIQIFKTLLQLLTWLQRLLAVPFKTLLT